MRKKKIPATAQATSAERARRALPESEERFRQLLENINEGIVIQNKKNIITYVNNKFLRMIGYRQDEVIGRPITALLGKGWLKKDRRGEDGAEKDRWKSAESTWSS